MPQKAKPGAGMVIARPMGVYHTSIVFCRELVLLLVQVHLLLGVVVLISDCGRRKQRSSCKVGVAHMSYNKQVQKIAWYSRRNAKNGSAGQQHHEQASSCWSLSKLKMAVSTVDNLAASIQLGHSYTYSCLCMMQHTPHSM